MDNFLIEVISQGREHFKTAMSLFGNKHHMVEGYRVDESNSSSPRMIFYWTESKLSTPLPFPMTLDQAAEFALGWLGCVNYGDEPDHDGDNGKGWRLYCEDWGHVGGEWQAFVAVEPVWAMYGK